MANALDLRKIRADSGCCTHYGNCYHRGHRELAIAPCTYGSYRESARQKESQSQKHPAVVIRMGVAPLKVPGVLRTYFHVAPSILPFGANRVKPTGAADEWDSCG